MLVGYWGQNSALPQSPKKLDYVCRNSKYDIVAVSFIHKLFDPRNKGKSSYHYTKILIYCYTFYKNVGSFEQHILVS